MNDGELRLFCKNSTIALQSLTTEKVPTGFASGCIVRYEGRRLILTVEHAVGDGNIWAVKTKLVEGPRQEYYFPQFTHVLKGTIDLGALASDESDPLKMIQDPKSLDFSLDFVDDGIEIYDYYPTDIPGTLDVYRLHEFTTELESEPTSSSSYAFYGQTRNVVDMAGKRITWTDTAVTGIRYWKSSGDFHWFNLPRTIATKEEYQGCSGAPIIDVDGNIVSLVASGLVGSNILLGVNLKKYKFLADIEAGKL